MVSKNAKLLLVVFLFTLFFSVTELGAGITSKSLLLMEESVHMFADSVSFGISLWAELRTEKNHSQLANLIGSGISLLTLAFTMCAVLFESIKRLAFTETHGVVVDSGIMLIFGIILCTFHLSCLFMYYIGFSVHSHGHSHHSSNSCSDKNDLKPIQLNDHASEEDRSFHEIDLSAIQLSSLRKSSCTGSQESKNTTSKGYAIVENGFVDEIPVIVASELHRKDSFDSMSLSDQEDVHDHAIVNHHTHHITSSRHRHGHGHEAEHHDHTSNHGNGHGHSHHDQSHSSNHGHSHGHGDSHQSCSHGAHGHSHEISQEMSHNHGHGSHSCGNADHCKSTSHNHTHQHSGSHGHSHSVSHGHNHSGSHGHGHAGSHGHIHAGDTCEHNHGDDSDCGDHGHSHSCCGLSATSLNMASAVFHIFIDFLHSFSVVLTAVLLKLVGETSTLSGVIDAAASLILALVIGGGVFVLGRAFFSQLRSFCSTRRPAYATFPADEEASK